MNEHTIEHDTKTHRNKEKYEKKHAPKPQQKKENSQLELPILYREKLPMALVDHMRQYDTRNQSIIKYDRYIK